MTIAEIKELVDIVTSSGIAELEIQRGDSRVRIRRTSAMTQEVLLPATAFAPESAATAGPPPSLPSPAGGGGNPGGASAKPRTLEEGHELVKSPIVGTYYDCPAPGAAPFVKVGDQVDSGQVLCIIESMKLMNEIECEVSGSIVAKLVENGRPVEYGEALFAIRPR